MYHDFEETRTPLKSEKLEAFAQLLARHASDNQSRESLTEIARAAFQGEKTINVRLPDDAPGWWSRIEGVDLTEEALALVVDRASDLRGELI